MKLSLKNINQFKNVIFNEKSNLEIIGGKNGTGKTTILDFIYESIELSNTTLNILAQEYLTKEIENIRGNLFISMRDVNKYDIYNIANIDESVRTIEQTTKSFNASVETINDFLKDYILDNFLMFDGEYKNKEEVIKKFKIKMHSEEFLEAELEKLFWSKVRKFITNELVDNNNMEYDYKYEDFAINVKSDDASVKYSAKIPKKKHCDVFYFNASDAHNYWKMREQKKGFYFFFNEELDKTFHKITNEIPIIEKSPDRKYYIHDKKNDKVKKRINRIATGLNVFMFLQDVITSDNFGENSIILLDEPDAHLHPEWVALLADVLTDLSLIKNVKIVVSTHNDFFINSLSHCYFSKVDSRQSSESSISAMNLKYDENNYVIGVESEINSAMDIVDLLEDLSEPKLELLYDRL